MPRRLVAAVTAASLLAGLAALFLVAQAPAAVNVDTLHRSRAVSGKVSVGGMAGTSGVRVSTPFASGADTANVWVSASGSYSGCARSASPVVYNAATDCPISNAATDAYSVAAAGDMIGVKGGAYGSITHPPNKTGSPAVTYVVAAGETVTGSFENGRITSGAGSGANNVTFTKGTGTCTFTSYRIDYTAGNTMDGCVVDGEFSTTADPQILHIENATNCTFTRFEIKNSRARGLNSNNTAKGAMTWLDADGCSFTDGSFNHALVASGSDAHTECVYSQGASNITFRRVSFYRCATEDIFLTGGTGAFAQNWTLENVWMERPGGPNHAALAFRTGGGPYPTGWLVRNSMIEGVQAPDSTSSATGSWVNNYFRTQAPCGWGSMTYSKNAGSSACANGVTVSNAAADAGWVAPDWSQTSDTCCYSQTPGNWMLLTGSPLKDVGDVTNYASVDFRGFARYFGVLPDIGPYEFGAS